MLADVEMKGSAMVSGRSRRGRRFGWVASAGIVTLGSWSLFAQTAGPADNSAADFSPKPPLVALTAADQAKTFVLPPGYRMEPVLSDPDVISPAVIEWDGDGRMYVAEFIT